VRRSRPHLPSDTTPQSARYRTCLRKWSRAASRGQEATGPDPLPSGRDLPAKLTRLTRVAYRLHLAHARGEDEEYREWLDALKDRAAERGSWCGLIA